MQRAEVLEIVTAKAVEMLAAAPGQLTEHTTFAELQADSLTLVEWTMDLEDAFGVELAEDAVRAAGSLGCFADLVLAALLAKDAPAGTSAGPAASGR